MPLAIRKALVALSPILQHGLAVLIAIVLILITGILAPGAPSQLYAVHIGVVVLLVSLYGRDPAFTFLGSITLLLAYFTLKGEGFAVSDPIDALGLVVFVLGNIVIINCVGSLRHSVDLCSTRLADSEAKRAFNDSAAAELSHRIGNDLNAMVGIATLTARAAEHEETRLALESLSQRIHTIGSIYARLRLARDATVQVEMQPFIADLCADMKKAYMNLRPVSLDVNVDPFNMVLDQAVLVGLIINELLTNALKYAFSDDRSGTIWIELSADAATNRPWLLTVIDDGIGFDGTAPKGTGFGQRLVRSMASQLKASFSLSRTDGRTCAELRFQSEEPARSSAARS